jgi:hypothetical protein
MMASSPLPRRVRMGRIWAMAFVVAQIIGLSTGRSHTFSIRIVQCEIGTHMAGQSHLDLSGTDRKS